MKIYLAGPDVFRPDAAGWAESARALCRGLGFEPLTPLDHDETEASRIFQANIGLIARAQVVVANLNPFRGAEPDSGTCFEIGYALALGKEVCGYVARRESLRERVNRHEQAGAERMVDSRGLAIENFGLPLNLMLAVPARIVEGGLEECLAELRRRSSAAGSPPADPRVKAAQESAMRYLRWVGEGRIEDTDPIATVAEQYEVKRETVESWIDAWSGTSTATQVEYRPDDVARQMKISGRQYRRLG